MSDVARQIRRRQLAKRRQAFLMIPACSPVAPRAESHGNSYHFLHLSRSLPPFTFRELADCPDCASIALLKLARPTLDFGWSMWAGSPTMNAIVIFIERARATLQPSFLDPLPSSNDSLRETDTIVPRKWNYVSTSVHPISHCLSLRRIMHDEYFSRKG